MIDAWPVHSSCSRLSMIHSCILCTVRAGLILVIDLCSRSVHMSLPERRLFLCIRSRADAMRTTVIADPVVDCRIMYDNGIVDINVMNNRTIHIHNSCIIPEIMSLPSASAKTRSIITITIVHAPIKTDMRSPITRMKSIIATGISPISRCP